MWFFEFLLEKSFKKIIVGDFEREREQVYLYNSTNIEGKMGKNFDFGGIFC